MMTASCSQFLITIVWSLISPFLSTISTMKSTMKSTRWILSITM